MRMCRTILICLLLGSLAVAGAMVKAAEPPSLGGAAALEQPSAHSEEPGLPQEAEEIARPSGFSVTNSMVVTWIVAAFLIIFARRAMKHVKEVPDGAQNFWEWLVESLHNFLEEI